MNEFDIPCEGSPEETPQAENPTQDLKFYSQGAIGIATFIGGPLAAGYLIRENYRALNETSNGKKSLVIGVVSTLLLFVGLFMLPESIIDKIPRQIIPLIYTAVVYWIVETIHGSILKSHKDNQNEFFSGWKAAGIGFVSLVLIFIGIFLSIFLSADNTIYEKYDREIAQFSINEAETMKFYEHLDRKTRPALIHELDTYVIPKWKENIQIVNQTNQFENLPIELVEQNKILIQYSELRIKAFELLRKAIDENTGKYAEALDRVHLAIDELLVKLE